MVMRNHPRDHRVPLTCRSRRHTPARALPTAPGLHLCSSCRDFVEETLVELPTLFDLCAYEAAPRDRAGSPGCAGAVSVRSNILGVLANWCGLVTGERGAAWPADRTIRAVVGFLGIHLHWLCQHPAAPDLVDDLTGLSVAVSAALGPEGTYRVAVGVCPRPDCARPVFAEAHREGDAPYEVACAAGHVWTPERWAALRGTTGDPPRPSPRGDGRARRSETAE